LSILRCVAPVAQDVPTSMMLGAYAVFLQPARESFTMAPRAIITGAAGLIGQYLVKTASRWAPGWDVRGLSRAELELTDTSKADAQIRALKPDLLIHCAALSRTKACEEDPDQARRDNVEVTAHLAQLCQGIPFIFLSSGEVFDGITGWYRETDEPNPINVYGQTKLEAEPPAHGYSDRTDIWDFAERRPEFCGRYVPDREGRQERDTLCRRVSLPASSLGHCPSLLGTRRSPAARPLSPGRERTTLALGYR
jgi:hypothetical protein